MKIAHEAPLCIMDEIRNKTDYDYALAHLFRESQEYYNFFKDSITKLNRSVIIDNSAFELGKAMEMSEFADWLKKLRPDQYIVPDVLGNANETIENFEKWLSFYKNIPGKKIGVVQGKTYKEIVTCYEFMSINADKIAICFNYSYYSALSNLTNKYKSFMVGRIELIKRLLKDNIFNKNKPHHLLGCSLPQEFIIYKNMPFIDSVDTSNPIIYGLYNIRYSKQGLNDKIQTKMIDFFNIDRKNIKNLDTIYYNISRFREFCL